MFAHCLLKQNKASYMLLLLCDLGKLEAKHKRSAYRLTILAVTKRIRVAV